MDLKCELRKLYGFPICLQQLLHKGGSLDDSKKLKANMDSRFPGSTLFRFICGLLIKAEH